MFDMTSYVLGYKGGIKEGARDVVLESDEYTFTDADSDGNIVIEEGE